MSLFDQFKSSYETHKKNAPSTGPISEGKYSMALDEVKCDMSGDVTRFSFIWKILRGLDSTDTGFEGRKVFIGYQLKEPSVNFFMQDLETMGVNFESYTDAAELAGALQELCGTTADCYVKPREYNGKTYYNCYLNEWNTADVLAGVDENEEISF